MDKIFYTLFIKLYPVAARFLALFNPKAKQWITGRKNIFTKIKNAVSADNAERVWVHCSSLGEFEQGRPVIEAIKKHYNNYKIVVTFFSPSGYEYQKNYSDADYVFYLPMDSKKNAKRFFNLIKPKLILFIKYEYWYYYLQEAKKRNIPLLLASGLFRLNQPFFKWYGNLYRQMLNYFTQLFVQNEASLQLLQSINFNKAQVSGDTRFDRVLTVAEDFKQMEAAEIFCRDKIVIVAGSTWLEDDEELDHYVNTHREYRFLIAPHNIGEARLQECEKLYSFSKRYSAFQKDMNVMADANDINTLIIDNIGMLKYLYAYATICYVGGGFGGDGVHNIPEAAVYSRPVIFGPVYEKFAEAKEIIEAGGAFSVATALQLEEIFDELLLKKQFYETASEKAGKYIQENAGATKIIMEYIQEKRLLTS